jgi:cytochrome c-type biogenesis protein CcmH/NrfG
MFSASSTNLASSTNRNADMVDNRIVALSAGSQAEANRLFNNRQYAEAAVIYEALLRRNPENDLNNFLFAFSLYEMGNLERARVHFERAGGRHRMMANFYLGEIYFKNREFEKALAAYRRHLDALNPNDRRVAMVQRKIEQTERMRLGIEEPIAEIPIIETPIIEAPVVEIPIIETPVVETPRIQETIFITPTEANRLFNNRQFAEAAKIYEILLQQNPDNELHNYYFAQCMYEMGNRNLALKHFEKASNRQPLANFYLGEIHSANHEFAKASEAYRRYLITLHAGDDRIPAIRQKITEAEHLLRGREVEIIVVSQPEVQPEVVVPPPPVVVPPPAVVAPPPPAVVSRPPVVNPTPAEANRLFENRQYAESGRMYEALLRQNPTSALYNYRFARCMYEAGDMELARQYFYRSGTRYALTDFYLGEIYFHQQEFEKSVAAYRKYLPTLRAGDDRIPGIREKIAQAEQMASANRAINNVVDSRIIELPTGTQTQEEAMRLFNNRQFTEAAAIYEALLRANPQNPLLHYRLARTFFEIGNMAQARVHFEQSGTQHPRRHYYLGEIYFMNYEFGNASAAYRQYLSTLRAGDSEILGTQRRIRQAEQAARMLLRVEDIAIIDSLAVDKENFLSYYRFNSERVAAEIGYLMQERIQINAHRTEDKITHITPKGDRKYFSDFVDGRMNIFTSHHLLNDWSNPLLLSNVINSGANESYPFLMSDGVTMFFASDGENSIGGYDIFLTKYIPSTNTFLQPENIGMPFNSPYNDYMLVIDEVNNVGWFASDRYQPEGKVMLYFFVPNESKVFLSTVNAEEIRSKAQLKTFRQAETEMVELVNVRFFQDMDFNYYIQTETAPVVSERTVQAVSQQPQSQGTTRVNRQEMERLVQQTEAMKKELDTLRQKYVNAKTAAERATVVSQMRDLSEKIQNNEQLMQQR